MTHQMRRKPVEDQNHFRLPVGQIMSEPVKGDFLALPLFGWVSVRAGTKTPLVMLSTLLVQPTPDDPVLRGTLNIELPVLPETEAATLAALERFGWDGRVWPTDDGWPQGSEADMEQLVMLMDSAGLRATLTFPPSAQGAKAQTVSVQRARGPFLMPPLPEPEAADIAAADYTARLERFRAVYNDPKAFHRPMGAAETPEGARIRAIEQLAKGIDSVKLRHQTESACVRLEIPFRGIEDRLEDLDRVATFVVDSELRNKVGKLAEESAENEKTLLRDVVRASLKMVPMQQLVTTLCFSCSVNPAWVTTGETVPLCEECAALMGSARGVEFKAEEPTD